ncbi:Alpha/Beta hydrolase protein [Boeremia exigua]|uniref:Alpha/Beta hydrolase protein n=1 Tax=Boeremia exigua TaxID=749465 RepID=UPI001E8D569A|nr:Alpha/Beta hydrolase protein [Boeremia exigua]KAH6638003.1 Alpha/Beta hydrolase protein [Boeremia exigua]
MATTTNVKRKIHEATDKTKTKAQAAIEFAKQAERLGQYAPDQETDATGSTQAVEARFVTAQDPVIQTAGGDRLPAVPIEEARKLNSLRDVLEDRDPSENEPVAGESRESRDGTIHGVRPQKDDTEGQREGTDAPLGESKAPSNTNPMFPPVPVYGPPSTLRKLHCILLRISSAVLSLQFLLVIILGAAVTSIPTAAVHVWIRLKGQNPDRRRPFFEEEERRKKARRAAEVAWKKQHNVESEKLGDDNEEGKEGDEFVPLEGGSDELKCDVRYYARRVGLDCEVFEVQTEDGFIIDLWHLYNPRDYDRTDDSDRAPRAPDVFRRTTSCNGVPGLQYPSGEKKYPVLMIHGLLQSAGAYCTNDDDSLAFYLAKSGYDVWLGNNRCGFNPRHKLLDYGDPRMWAWNIRQMGVMDLPALISRVLSETGFEKLGLIAHSQGTTQTLVALAKEQRPEIGDKISVFCALAPAAYAGPLIQKAYFKFMQVISPSMFRIVFGIHAFIPFMMTMHSLLPGKLYGAMGYRVFSFLFNWTDERWDRGLRDRLFQFSPVYVSAESMRWWLGRECFAKHKCILSTREEKTIEEEEDEDEDRSRSRSRPRRDSDEETSDDAHVGTTALNGQQPNSHTRDSSRARFAWYGPHTPPFALWVCGADELVDGRRLLRRFERNREPFVDVVHSKVIEGYEHLDVIWAMDAIEKVGKEVRAVLWKTAPEEARRVCRTPRGCEDVGEFYRRSEGRREGAAREVDATAGEWSQRGAEQVKGSEQIGGGEGKGYEGLEAEKEVSASNERE